VLRDGLSSLVPLHTGMRQPSNMEEIVDRIQHRDGNEMQVAEASDNGAASDDDIELPDVPSTMQHQPSSQSSSNVTGDVTSAERASNVIATGQITPDTKLDVFRVNSTTEPRIIQLFLRASCSCPERARCYHMTAARMAVGLTEDQPQHQQLSLTQLCRNTCKQPGKTCGRH